MTRDEMVALMETSRSDQEWASNCDKVKAAFDGFPEFWSEAIIHSGLAKRLRASWKRPVTTNRLREDLP